MKTIIIGDLHLDKKTETIQEKIDLLKEIFNKDAGRIIFAGDIFDNGKAVSTVAIKLFKELLYSTDKEIYLILGNHDIRFKNTLLIHTLTPFNNIPNVHIVSEPLDIGNFTLIPWICEENSIKCIDAIRNSKQKYCVGHFSIQGFEMGGRKCMTGLKKSYFKYFEKVFSGHFHVKQQDANIIYVGSLCQETWIDFEDQKGYYLVDNSDIKFYNHSKQIYKYLILENNKSDFDLVDYENTHIKVFHAEKLSKKQFNKLEDLKASVRSYKIFDESVIIVETKVDKVEFDVMVKEYLKDQEMDKEHKESVIWYLIETNNAIKEK